MKRRFALAAARVAQLARQVLPVGMVSVCIGCGCDDHHACRGGCWWLRVDRETGLGICSECGHLVEAWDRGERDGAPHAA